MVVLDVLRPGSASSRAGSCADLALVQVRPFVAALLLGMLAGGVAGCTEPAVVTGKTISPCGATCVEVTGRVDVGIDVAEETADAVEEVDLPIPCSQECDDGDPGTADLCKWGVCQHAPPPSLTAYLKPPGPAVSERFGYSLALRGDRLAAGFGDVVAVFAHNGVGWQEEASVSLTLTDGCKVDISSGAIVLGDGRLVAGATRRCQFAQYWPPYGRVVLAYRKQGQAWVSDGLSALVDQVDGKTSQISLAVAGDTLAVGLPPAGNVTAGGIGGTVRIYTATPLDKAAGWQPTATWQAGTSVAMRAGRAIAIDGDTIAVGAPESALFSIYDEPLASPSSGAVFVLERAGAKWAQSQTLQPANLSKPMLFGRGVALHHPWLAVGAPNDSGMPSTEGGEPVFRHGSVYLYQRAAGLWQPVATLHPQELATYGLFGTALALNASHLVVGSVNDNGGGQGINPPPGLPPKTHSGAAFLFALGGGVWQQQARIKAPNAEPGDGLGYQVALSGQRLAVGAQGEDGAGAGVGGALDDNSAPGRGAVYVYDFVQ